MSKLGNVRVIEIPKFKAVSSGLDTFDSIFGEGGFFSWVQAHDMLFKKSIYGHAYDFMWHEGDKNIWIWAVEDWVTEIDAAPFELIEFEGGIYVVAVADEKDDIDCGEVYYGALKWIEEGGVFEPDDRPGHRCIFHHIGYNLQDVMNVVQQEMFLPVRVRLNITIA